MWPRNWIENSRLYGADDRLEKLDIDGIVETNDMSAALSVPRPTVIHRDVLHRSCWNEVAIVHLVHVEADRTVRLSEKLEAADTSSRGHA